ncbi:MAG: bifunctional precorrin-2 dehydrogenase/sirohydrochlorin ferrochelatase [Acidobacteriota bacterium]|nr:bifunctional precorrin-2 dehydrogenase/sirohydrochlorin ferrochelatase [Acidobacteriota bacterium]
MRYYPVYLDLKDRAILVVGGGRIAEGKALQLIEAGARVRLVSPDLTPRLRESVEQEEIEYRQGEFKADDLRDVVLVISATSDQAANEEVARLAAELRLLCNVVDQPALCNFITPALVTRGDLQISVSTGGGSPSVAQRVKREIGELIGDEYASLLELAAEMRAEAKRLIQDFEARRPVLHAFVESEAIELLRAGKREEAQKLAFDLLRKAVTETHTIQEEEKQ